MGLDMYLSKKRYVSTDERKTLKITGLDGPVDPSKVECIIEEAAYWRKANAIHHWFVVNVQHGQDECAAWDVSREQLATLLELVDAVLEDESKARDVLPTQPGFFFGGLTYDDDYRFDLTQTQLMLVEALRDNDPDVTFVYQASW